MAPKKSAAIDFKTLIFYDASFTHAAWILVFKDLESNPDQVSDILSDKTELKKFLTNFDKYAERISQFFRHADRSLVSMQVAGRPYVKPGLPDALIRDFLPLLLSDEFCHFQMKPAFHYLLISIIGFCLTIRHARLGALAKALGEKDQLLQSLVSGEKSGQVMRKWIHAFDTRSPLFESAVFTAWTKRLVALCRSCGGNHLVSRQFNIWRDLQNLISRLTLALDRSAPRPILIAPEDSELLGNFGIPPPASERALHNTLEQLQRDEMVKVLQALADSFPCRLCYEASACGPMGEATTEEEFPEEQAEQFENPELFTGLFGPDLGIWRIHLSAQALKDLGQSQFEGMS